MRVFQGFGKVQRGLFVTKEGFADSLLEEWFKRVNIFDHALGIGQPIVHLPNTASWDFTFPVLKSCAPTSACLLRLG